MSIFDEGDFELKITKKSIGYVEPMFITLEELYQSFKERYDKEFEESLIKAFGKKGIKY